MARFVGGWFKAWRDAWDKDLGENLALWGLWNALLHMATWKPSKIIWEGKQREIPAGSVVFGISELAEQWECSKSTISKWLKYLHDTGRISIETCPRGTLVTVCNWEKYQAVDISAASQGEHNANTERTQAEHSANLSEEDKKGRRKNPRSTYPEEFESLYKLYPRKEGKSDAFAVYKRVITSDDDRAKLRTAIENYARAKAGTEIQYLRHFDRFMRTWTDWLDPTTGQANPSINVKPINLDDLEDSA